MAVGYAAGVHDVELSPLTAAPGALLAASPASDMDLGPAVASSHVPVDGIKMDNVKVPDDVPPADATSLQKLRHECVRWADEELEDAVIPQTHGLWSCTIQDLIA